MKNTLQLSDTELQMMKEVSVVFSKYKKNTRRFGIQLIHSHFPILKDEVLYETHDNSNRTLITKPTKAAKIKNALATAWEFNENFQISISSYCCEASGEQTETTHD